MRLSRAVRALACGAVVGLSGAAPTVAVTDGWEVVRACVAVLLPAPAGAKDFPCAPSLDGATDPLLPGGSEVVSAPKKKAWQEALGGEEAAQPHIRARLAGWPERILVPREELPADDEGFLRRLARDTWRGLDAFTDRESGLPVNNVRFTAGFEGRLDAHIGDYTSTTDVGLHLVAVVAAYELELLSKAQAIERIEKTLTTLEGVETYNGFFFNYYDTTSLERTSNFLSFVDSAWLTAGLMVVRTALPALADRGAALIGRMNYDFFYDGVESQMSHGYYVSLGRRSRFHYRTLYTEARLGSLIAIGKGDVPERHWFEMIRTFASDCAWQTMPPLGTRTKTVRGFTFSAGYYEWGGLQYVPSWGGSMFEALMPTLLLDEQRYASKSLGANDVVHAALQRRYAADPLGYAVWGLSPSASPAGNGYGEYGVRVLGSRGYEPGAVTPHASALAVPLDPPAATANLRALAERYPLYGDFGFYDAVDPLSGEVAYHYLALDQEMLFIAVANHLTSGRIQQHFADDPIARQMLPVIADENFFD